MKDLAETAALLERVARLTQNLGAAEGLNSVQWETLRFIDRANRFSCTPSGLTDYLGITKGTVSQTINAMERKGFVKKVNVPGNARSVRIEITPNGRTLLSQNPLLTLTEDLGELSNRDLHGLTKNLRHIIEKSLSRREGSAFGMCRTCRHFELAHKEGDPHRCGLLAVPLTISDANLICREHSA